MMKLVVLVPLLPYLLGASIKYVTLFLTNFDPPSPVTLCHTSQDPPESTSHISDPSSVTYFMDGHLEYNSPLLRARSYIIQCMVQYAKTYMCLNSCMRIHGTCTRPLQQEDLGHFYQDIFPREKCK